ncbi:MAG: DNA translocase FtsK [Anaerolineaceae bacterium]|jgi:S-DNA-T family DNA segregation ATPase FtsK/SpoIIIE|nr:MAG: DNA translocase FtsK [Anaerolineaceae bacterium]
MKSKSDNAFKLLEYFQRFFKDIIGVVLISTASISLLGFFHLSQGKFLNSLVDIIKQGFGWGAVFFLLSLFYVGVVILFRRIESFPDLNLKRLLYLELFFFSSLGFLAIFGGNSLVRAADGKDGGVIGWGIAKICSSLLPLPVCSILLFVIALGSLFIATGLLRKIVTGIQKKISQETNPKTEIEKIQSSSSDRQPTPSRAKASTTSVPEQRSRDLPPLSILMEQKKNVTDEGYIKQNAHLIEQTFEEFGIPASVVGYRIGPTVIQYALEPGYVDKTNEDGEISKRKIRVSQISSLQRDLALALGAERLRIEAPIPGYSFVGIEVPNRYSNMVRLKSVLASEQFQKVHSSLRLALGLDVSGNSIVADLAKMPHLLIAGTTGSGKSVCISSLIASLVMCNTPDELRMAILDPKWVELALFNGLPHLLGEVETNINRMLAVLAWAVAEMERRYKIFEELNARDINVYNIKAGRRGLPSLPKIVIFIDELASLMMAAPEQTEGHLVHLAQMARATGIHLVIATQRPSTDVVTGLIKANFPARIAFMVASSVDSRVILDMNGAETLLGKGDMLFLDPDNGAPKRIQGVMVDDMEIRAAVEYWNTIYPPDRDGNAEPPWEKFVIHQGEDGDELVGRAIALLKDEGRASASLLQRKLRIGYPRAARLMDELEEMGIVGPPETGGKDREVILDDDSDDADEPF